MSDEFRGILIDPKDVSIDEHGRVVIENKEASAFFTEATALKAGDGGKVAMMGGWGCANAYCP